MSLGGQEQKVLRSGRLPVPGWRPPRCAALGCASEHRFRARLTSREGGCERIGHLGVYSGALAGAGQHSRSCIFIAPPIRVRG